VQFNLDNLYVVDGSFFPSSAAVNPTLTIDEVARYNDIEYPLHTNRWADGSVDPHGYRQIESFTLDGTIPTPLALRGGNGVLMLLNRSSTLSS
jgi:GMC oxidoreductase